MSLPAWQDALAQLIVTRGRGRRFARKGLSHAERHWLRSLPTTSGFEMTCTAQRWWRTLAVTDTAPLALGLLNAVGRCDLLDDYFQKHAEASLFPLQDGLRFLEFLVEHPTAAKEVPHVVSVATFEHGLLRLTQAASVGDVSTQPLVVHFGAPPVEVLSAILAGSPPPEPSSDYWLLLAPDLPNFSREATPDEVRQLRARV